MTISSDGQICFGVQLREDEQMPWDQNKFDCEIEEWWFRGVNTFTSSFEMYDEVGDLIKKNPDWTQDEYDTYWKEWMIHRKNNPMPVAIVMHCSYENPLYIVAVKGTFQYAPRGYPQHFETQPITEAEHMTLSKFITEHDLPTEGDHDWWLTSLYG